MKKMMFFHFFLLIPFFLYSKTSSKSAEDPPSRVFDASYDPNKAIYGFQIKTVQKGVRVTGVYQGGPAHKAGLVAGDLILKINQESVLGKDDQDLLKKIDASNSITLSIKSKDETEKVIFLTKTKQGDFMKNGIWTRVGQYTSEFPVGSNVPELKAVDSKNHEIALSSLKGKIVLINFTASWCSQNEEEIPLFKAAYEKYYSRGLEIISVFLDGRYGENYVHKNDLRWLVKTNTIGWVDPIRYEWGVDTIPTSILLDRDGKVFRENVRGKSILTTLDSLFH